jgi:uncharacterized membrane protein
MLRRAMLQWQSAFRDGVFAVLITALLATWLSYTVSYLFIAIVWTNDDHLMLLLMRYAKEATPSLSWYFRSIATLCLVGVAAAVALKLPPVGLGICICCRSLA